MIEQLLRYRETIEYISGSSFNLYKDDEQESCPAHWHSGCEIIYSIDGICEIICENRNYTLRPYDILIIHKGAIHELKTSTHGSRYIMHFELETFYNFEDIHTLVSSLPCVIYLSKDVSSKLYQSIHKSLQSIIKEYYANSPYSNIMIQSKLLSILTILGRGKLCLPVHDSNRHINFEHSKLYLLTLDYIHKNYSRNITLDEISIHAGFSKYHFSRLYKQYSNETFYYTLNRIRMKQASIYLKESSLSIPEIAIQCGFHNISSFIRMFKLHYHMTPVQYKKSPF